MFKVLRYKANKDLYGVILQQEVCVQHIPELFLPLMELSDLVKYVDPLIKDPFKDFDFITVELKEL